VNSRVLASHSRARVGCVWAIQIHSQRRPRAGYCGGRAETTERWSVRWSSRQREREGPKARAELMCRSTFTPHHNNSALAPGGARVSGRRKHLAAGVPGTAWHFTGWHRSRGSPTPNYRSFVCPHLPPGLLRYARVVERLLRGCCVASEVNGVREISPAARFFVCFSLYLCTAKLIER